MPSNPLTLVPEPHPVVGVLEMRRRSITGLAKETDYSAHHMNRVLLGYMPASTALREAVSRALGLPESELFYGTPTSSRFPGDTVETQQ
jgi:hypothetical protein